MENLIQKPESNDQAEVNINSFYTVSVLGKGSYAKVLLVKRKDNNLFYALKKLKKSMVLRKKQEKHIKTERDILVQVESNPFIVKLYNAFQNDKNLYFVLEYCPGGELFNLLQNKRRLNAIQTKFYAAQMVLALEHLHKYNVIYRDLKPENVLITANGYIKIADFGLSRMNVTQNNAKSICGTPEYLAPEILMKLGYGKAIDWWTLGNIIYEMLVGIPPFYTDNRKDLFDKIKFYNPKYPSFLDPTAKSLIESLLRKDPSKRLGTVRGSDEIKEHPFFENVNWKWMEEQKYEPFFIPKISKDYGLDNFDKEFTELPIESLGLSSERQAFENFEGFTWDVNSIRKEQVNTEVEEVDMIIEQA